MHGSGNTIRRIAILGGGTAGWMAAAALSRALAGTNTSISVIASDEIGTIGVGEASVPGIRAFVGFLGLDEREFMRECHATFKLGIQFMNWGAQARRYFHSFTHLGLDPNSRQFHRLFQRYALGHAACGQRANLDDYNLGAVAAHAERFGLPARSHIAPSGILNYAYHFDAALLAKYLRSYSECHGVEYINGTVDSVPLDERGFIRSLILADGREVAADFFVDCSGFAGILIERALQSGYDEWSKWLPCDRAIALPSVGTQSPPPFTCSTAMDAGWIWRIPLQSRIGNGQVYCSEFMSDDAAEGQLRAQLNGEALAGARRIRFTTGKRRRTWIHNCVALGLAAGFLEPLESTSVHLVQSALFRLISLFPDQRFEPAEIAAFNRQTDEEYEDIREFLVLHYKLTSRVDTPFWRHCRDIVVSDRLKDTIEMFSASGRLLAKPEQLFTVNSWLAVLYGQGALPRGFDPLLAPLEDDDLERKMGEIRGTLGGIVSRIPRHAEFLARYCGSKLPT